FLKLRCHPRLDGWGAVNFKQGDLHSTADKKHMELDSDGGPGMWPIYKGASFNLWTPDTGVYYGWAHGADLMRLLQDRRASSAKKSGSPFEGFSSTWIADPDSLPARRARVAYRRIGRATDSRTMICCLVPP